MQPIKTAFFSGTFNPVHTGHLILANYLCEYEGFDEIWLSVSPQNPLREKLSSNNDRQRIEMLNMAVNGNSKIRTTDIEFTLPRPSYTIQTLEALRKKYPERIFTLIIGADNWLSFNRWKDYDKIIEEYPIYIYPRRGLRHRRKVAACKRKIVSCSYHRNFIDPNTTGNFRREKYELFYTSTGI